MQRGTTVQYVQFYTAGSAARQVTPVVPQRKTAQRAPKLHKKLVVRVDPVAVLGVVAAVVMLALMITGIFSLRAAQEQTMVMEQYVQTLQERNEALEAQYAAGYDIVEVERMALALGMVPCEQAQQASLQLSVPQEPTTQNLSFWDSVSVFLASLFA